ncbi:MAG: GNAT family N-acetyltransferase, partial [Culicoidibacterales bacterium]
IIQPHDLQAFTIIAKWDNDPKLAEFFRPNFSLEPLPHVTAEELQQAAQKGAANKSLYFIEADGVPIGYISIEANFFMLLSQTEAAWISLCIGEASWRGRGVGQQALAFIEEIARKQGFPLIELGVFAYNTPAQALYKKCGYQQFANVPDFVYYQGQKHADLRFKKQLFD